MKYVDQMMDFRVNLWGMMASDSETFLVYAEGYKKVHLSLVENMQSSQNPIEATQKVLIECLK